MASAGSLSHVLALECHRLLLQPSLQLCVSVLGWRGFSPMCYIHLFFPFVLRIELRTLDSSGSRLCHWAISLAYRPCAIMRQVGISVSLSQLRKHLFQYSQPCIPQWVELKEKSKKNWDKGLHFSGEHSLLSPSPSDIDRHLGCLLFGIITDKVNIEIHIVEWVYTFLFPRWMPIGIMTGSHSRCILKVLRDNQDAFQWWYFNLQSFFIS